MGAPHSEYPNAADVAAFLASIPNVTVPNEFALDPYVDAAIAEWERLTDYAPFLSSGDSEIRRFDPPGPRTTRPTRGGGRNLRFGAGLLSLTSLTVGTVADSAGQALIVDQDFWLWPSDAPAKGRPYTAIEFRSPQYGEPRSIIVTGIWGFGSTIPNDAWLAIRDLAAGGVLAGLREGVGLAPVEVKDDDISVRLSIERLGSMGEELLTRGSRIAASYRLVS